MDNYIGKRLDGRYEIRELIGAGGMACVYKAYDSIDAREVAVKILRDEYLGSEDFTRRFRNESRAIAILSHPNIVKVFDVSFGTNLQYIVMEYIDGITLKEYIDQQRDIKWKEAVHFTVQILRALQHAHDKGIVHRDIKPQNIMLLADGTIKVTDFGIARFSRADSRHTKANAQAIGSVHYISPEQARGELTDEKADIYSVGVMLYEMLTGKLPFEADSAVSVAIKQLQEEPRRLTDIKPEVPEGLEEITLKAMQKEPEKRYQSSAEMLADIDEFKRNPSIHFEYKYFNDTAPTRFVEAITRVKGELEGEKPAAEAEETPEEEEEGHKGPPMLPILAGIAAAFVLMALVLVGVVFFTKIFVDEPTNPNKIKVPELAGIQFVNEAELKAKYPMLADVKLVVEYENNEAEQGSIIKTEPSEKKNMDRDGKLTLIVSNGPRQVEVPVFTEEMSKDDYKLLLLSAGLTVGEEKGIPDDEKVLGVVLKVSPEAGVMVNEGTEIRIYYSLGPKAAEPVEMPKLDGITRQDAENLLGDKGIILPVIEVVNSDLYDRADVVISQEPAFGTQVKPGETPVKLVVSSGYRDVRNLVLQLPEVDFPVTIKVFDRDGKRMMDPAYTTELQNILPSAANYSLTLNFSERLEDYYITFTVARAGTTEDKRLAEYSLNGKKGTYTLAYRHHPFETTTAPPTTTGTTRSTTKTGTTTTRFPYNTTTTQTTTTTTTTTETTEPTTTTTDPDHE